MRYFVLIILLLMPFPVLAQTGAPSITISSQYTNYPTGFDITFTATVVSGTVSAVSFYYSGQGTYKFLGVGTKSGPSTFTYVWNSVPQGVYNVIAVAGNATPAIVSTSNGPIDLVSAPPFSQTPVPNPAPNPAQDPSFGEGGSGFWLR